MELSGTKIEELVLQGVLVISPFDPAQLNPNSYNLRLSDKLLVYELPVLYGLDMAVDPPTREITIPPDGYWLSPGELYLGSTVEHTYTPAPYRPHIDGRSSVGRLGVQVHITAGFGDTEFRGAWTLELLTVYRTKVYAGMQICQISYHEVLGSVHPYSGKYQNQHGPRKSMIFKEIQQLLASQRKDRAT